MKEWKDALFISRGKHGCIIRAINHVIKASFLPFVPQKTLSFSIHEMITENTFCIHILKIPRKKKNKDWKTFHRRVVCFGLADVSMKVQVVTLSYKFEINSFSLKPLVANLVYPVYKPACLPNAFIVSVMRCLRYSTARSCIVLQLVLHTSLLRRKSFLMVVEIFIIV